MIQPIRNGVILDVSHHEEATHLRKSHEERVTHLRLFQTYHQPEMTKYVVSGCQ